LVHGQTTIANTQLECVENKMAILANLSGHYLLDQKTSFSKDSIQRFLSTKKPEPLLSKSRIVVYSKDSGEKYTQNLSRIGWLHPLLKFIYSYQCSLDMTYVCTSDGYYISYPWNKLNKNYSPFKRDWYKKAVKASGKTVWIGPYISAKGNKIILTCARAVKNFEGKIIAVCGLDISVKDITDNLAGMKLIHSEEAFLLDKKGNILARRNMKTNGMQWFDRFKKDNLLQSKSKSLRELAIKMLSGEEGVKKISIPGEPELYIAYAPVSITGWSIGVSVRSDVLTASIYKLESSMNKNIQKHKAHIKDYFTKNLKIYLISSGVILIMVMIWGVLFSRKITAPVLILKKKALKIMKGDFKSNIHLATGDELERIDKTFDKMSKEISRYMKHVSNTIREREKIEQEFMVAGNIQSFMLPPKFKGVKEVKIESYLQPAHEVSGDFYNYSMLDDENLFFCIGKVIGKGVPAAMLMSQVMTLFNHLGSMHISPEKLLLNVNNALLIRNKTDMSVAAFCAYLNIKTGKLVFSNAEDVPVIFIHEGEVFGPETEKSLALGINTVKEGVFKQKTLQLSSGDTLLFSTNGIDKLKNERGEIFGQKHLLSSFYDFKHKKSNIIKFALEQLKEFYSSKISKRDIALLAIKYKGRKL
ncbi:MAG: SpoIIE family protein phosphatase, partial [Victivallales bacterium]|nr:SpoIIE family protein phosphatase [Victivallales bacterium]